MKGARPWLLGALIGILVAMTPVRAIAVEASSPLQTLPAIDQPASPEGASLAQREPRDVSQNYAQREARAPQAADFRGGDGFGIYIGSGAALVLAVVLLVLLLR